MFNREFIKITLLYTVGVIVFFYTILSLLNFALPEAKLDMVRAVSTSFGINLPDDMELGSGSKGGQVFLVVGMLIVLSIGLIVLNVFFSAIVTARLIQPRIALITSMRGVLSTKWNTEKPHMLVRLSNFHKAPLADVRIETVLTVEEVRSNGVKNEQFLSYLPIPEFSPKNILFMEPKMPWSIAVPADSLLNSSLTKDYHFKPGEKILHSFSAGKKIESVKRTLQILIRGTDTHSQAPFTIHRKIPVDSQEGETYTLHLHRGSFKSLPLHIDAASELEQYVD